MTCALSCIAFTPRLQSCSHGLRPSLRLPFTHTEAENMTTSSIRVHSLYGSASGVPVVIRTTEDDQTRPPSESSEACAAWTTKQLTHRVSAFGSCCAYAVVLGAFLVQQLQGVSATSMDLRQLLLAVAAAHAAILAQAAAEKARDPKKRHTEDACLQEAASRLAALGIIADLPSGGLELVTHTRRTPLHLPLLAQVTARAISRKCGTPVTQQLTSTITDLYSQAQQAPAKGAVLAPELDLALVEGLLQQASARPNRIAAFGVRASGHYRLLVVDASGGMGRRMVHLVDTKGDMLQLWGSVSANGHFRHYETKGSMVMVELAEDPADLSMPANQYTRADLPHPPLASQVLHLLVDSLTTKTRGALLNNLKGETMAAGASLAALRPGQDPVAAIGAKSFAYLQQQLVECPVIDIISIVPSEVYWADKAPFDNPGSSPLPTWEVPRVVNPDQYLRASPMADFWYGVYVPPKVDAGAHKGQEVAGEAAEVSTQAAAPLVVTGAPATHQTHVPEAVSNTQLKANQLRDKARNASRSKAKRATHAALEEVARTAQPLVTPSAVAMPAPTTASKAVPASPMVVVEEVSGPLVQPATSSMSAVTPAAPVRSTTTTSAATKKEGGKKAKSKARGASASNQAQAEAPSALSVAAVSTETKAAVDPKLAELEGVVVQEVAGDAAEEAPAGSNLVVVRSKSNKRNTRRRAAAKKNRLADTAGVAAPAAEAEVAGDIEVAPAMQGQPATSEVAGVAGEVVSQPPSLTLGSVVEVVTDSGPDSPRCVSGADQTATPVVSVKVPVLSIKMALVAAQGSLSPRGGRPSSRCRSRSCSRGPVSRPTSPAPAALEAAGVVAEALNGIATPDTCDAEASADAVCQVVADRAPSVFVSRASSPSALIHQGALVDQTAGHQVISIRHVEPVDDLSAEPSLKEVSMNADSVVVTLPSETEVTAVCSPASTLSKGDAAEAQVHVVVDMLDSLYTGMVPVPAAVLGGTSGVTGRSPGLLQSLRGALNGLKSRARSGMGRLVGKVAQGARAAVNGLAATAWELVEWVVPLKRVIAAWKEQGTAPLGV